MDAQPFFLEPIKHILSTEYIGTSAGQAVFRTTALLKNGQTRIFYQVTGSLICRGHILSFHDKSLVSCPVLDSFRE